MDRLCRLFGHKRREWKEVLFVDGTLVSDYGLQIISPVDPLRARWGEDCQRCGLRLSEGPWVYAECKVHGKILSESESPRDADEAVVSHFKLPHDDERSVAERKDWELRRAAFGR